MDPISQGVIGAVASQNVSKKTHLITATIVGALAGMSADLDILIRSDTDPLMFLEYHRQFTHSLIFIPVGGMLCALLFFPFLRRWGVPFKHLLIYATLGYATHGLLDSCTSYGTQLLWPFSDHRVAWNTISIIDPLFTLPLVILLSVGLYSKNQRYARLALIWIVLYVFLGIIQRERAEVSARELATSRGHVPERMEVKPGFGSLVLWKSIYEADGLYYVDGIRVAWSTSVLPGESIPRLKVDEDLTWLNELSQQANDLARFQRFSKDFVALRPGSDNQVFDVRYSILPNEIETMWMIELDSQASSVNHVNYFHLHQDSGEKTKILWQLILGRITHNKSDD